MKYRNNKKSYFVSLYVLIVFIFLSFSTYFLLSDKNYIDDSWQNYATYDFEQEVTVNEDGEEVAVNLISTPEQLAGLFMLQSNNTVSAENHKTYFTSSGSYKLKNDIDLSGKSWTPTTNSSSTTLDGNNYKIKNLTVSNSGDKVGFISKNSGTIKNVYFENVSITNTRTDGVVSYTGTVCGYNIGTIKNVSVLSGTLTGNVYKSTNSDRSTGGICGYNKGGTISHCINYATINCGKFLGGIAGKSSGTITSCYNYGKIANPGRNTFPRLGGITGELETNASISLCMNWGEINGYFRSEESKAEDITDLRIGGIAGHSSVSVTKCGNYGNVIGGTYECFIYYSGVNNYGTFSANKTYAGGVAGYCTQSITYSYNFGNVTSDAKFDSKDELSSTSIGAQEQHYEQGGYGSNVYQVNLYDASKSIQLSQKEAYAGGICGYMESSDSKITGCYNTGTISGGKVTTKLNLITSLKRKNGDTGYPLYSPKYAEIGNLTSCLSYVSAVYYHQLAPNTSNFESCMSSNNPTMPTSIDIDVSGVATLNTSISTSDGIKPFDIKCEALIVRYGCESSNVKLFITFFTGQSEISGYIVSKAYSTTNNLSVAVCTNSALKCQAGANKLGSSIWKYNSNINSGYPYIDNMYW